MSRHSNEELEKGKGKAVTQAQDPARSDQDANADRGGTTDLDSSIRKTHTAGSGSGMGTKRGVTGSDFDGQVTDQ